jgi:hypothetical protein
LLEEEIASVREGFAYAEQANEERAAIEREACLAPEGETWSMMLRQESALDRSIDRKVRILLRLRKDFADLASGTPGEGDGARTENKEEAVHSDNMSERSKGREVVEHSITTERSGNFCENKGSASRRRERSSNDIEEEVVGMAWVVCGKSRSQESEVRSQNKEHLPLSDCQLLTADCLLPTAYCNDKGNATRTTTRLPAWE